VNFLEQRNSLTSAARTLLATGHPPLGATQFCFSVSMPSRIRNRFAVGEGGEGFESDIDADCIIENGKRLGFPFGGEANVPLAALAFDRDRFNLACNGAVQFNFDLSDALNAKRISSEFDSITVTGKRDAIETSARLEAREARFLMSFHPKEKRLEGFVYSPKNILAAGEVCKTQISSGANIFQLIRLVVVVERFLGGAIGIATFLQSAVVESAGFAKLASRVLPTGGES